MRPTTYLPLLLAGLPLPLAPAQAPLAAERALPADFMTPDRVIHDVNGDEAWAMGASWKASFGPDGASYIPFLDSAGRSLAVESTRGRMHYFEHCAQ